MAPDTPGRVLEMQDTPPCQRRIVITGRKHRPVFFHFRGDNMATKTNYTVNGKEYYRIRRKVDGEMKPFYGSSKLDAERKYKQFLEERAEQKYLQQMELDNATLGERAEEYVNNVLSVSQKYAKGTIRTYKMAYETYIKDSELAEMFLKDVKASTVQSFYNDLDVSQQRIKTINKFMSAFSKWLVLNNYAVDFLSAVELPKKKDNSRQDDIVIWEDKEIREILRSMNRVPAPSKRHRQFFLIHVLLYTGMRISEALALKYSDINDGIISVERQHYLGEIKEPKYNSKRQIPMHHKLSQAFKAHRQWHEAEMKKNGYKTEFVFTTATGNLYSDSSIRHALIRFYKKRGIPQKKIHTYRSTFCTQLCRCGVPLEVASKLLGHKSLEVTAQHYALVRKETQVDAINKLNYYY